GPGGEPVLVPQQDLGHPAADGATADECDAQRVAHARTPPSYRAIIGGSTRAATACGSGLICGVVPVVFACKPALKAAGFAALFLVLPRLPCLDCCNCFTERMFRLGARHVFGSCVRA